eukprot:Rmarinus@m.26385
MRISTYSTADIATRAQASVVVAIALTRRMKAVCRPETQRHRCIRRVRRTDLYQMTAVLPGLRHHFHHHGTRTPPKATGGIPPEALSSGLTPIPFPACPQMNKSGVFVMLTKLGWLW